MTLSRKDFVRLSVVALGSSAALLEACGTPMTDMDGGVGGGGGATGGGGTTGGGTGGGTTGGGGGGATGGGGGATGGGGGATGGGGGSTGGGGGATGGGGGSTGGGGGSTGGGGGSTGGGGGSTGGGGGSSSTCANNGAHDTAITGNHGHTLVAPAADFMPGTSGMRTYDITGSSGHPHSVTLSAAQRTTIAGGGSVTVTSTVGLHMHDVTVGCA